MTDTEAVQELLPGSKWQISETGELTMQMDGGFRFAELEREDRADRVSSAVRLKRFPVQKSFWQQVQVREYSRRTKSLVDRADPRALPFPLAGGHGSWRFDGGLDALQLFEGIHGSLVFPDGSWVHFERAGGARRGREAVRRWRKWVGIGQFETKDASRVVRGELEVALRWMKQSISPLHLCRAETSALRPTVRLQRAAQRDEC